MANPIRPISLPVLVPKTLFLWNGGVHLATLVLLAMGALVLGFLFVITALRAAAVPAAGAPATVATASTVTLMMAALLPTVAALLGR